MKSLPSFAAIVCLGAARLSGTGQRLTPLHTAWYNDLERPVVLEGVVAAYPDARDAYTNLRPAAGRRRGLLARHPRQPHEALGRRGCGTGGNPSRLARARRADRRGARPLRLELTPNADGTLAVVQNRENPLTAVKSDQAIAKGVLHENTGNRYKSRLSVAYNELKAKATK